MWYEDMFTSLEKLKDDNQAIKMANYMQNKFIFLGLPKPKLSNFMRPYLKESKKYSFNWNFIKLCWDKEYREAQYIGIAYLSQNIKFLTKDDLENIKYLIVNKSWWETVDSLDAIVGEIVLQNNELEKSMIDWSNSSNMWLRRVAIDYQQRYKEKTNMEMLEKIIFNNLGSNEFFINKAIGWSLREYSKVNSSWVEDFIKRYKSRMNKLSIKEASKYLEVK